MGIIVDVYRCADKDCSKDGISSRYSRLCVVNVDGPFEPCDDLPACRLEQGYVPNSAMIVIDGENRRGMFGGNYAGTSDSRFGEAVSKILGGARVNVVAIHDRFE